MASAYGRDVLHTAGSIYLLTTLPPVFFALQGYRFWSGVIGGAIDGYAQDGVFGAVAGAINSVNPFAHVGISVANTVDEAEKGNYKAAGEHGYRTAVGILGIAIAAIGVGVGRGIPAGSRVNLPAWRNVTIDMKHVRDRHMPGGKDLAPGHKKDLFHGMTEKQVEIAVRHAYRYGEVLKSQGDRTLVKGPFGKGTIEMWLNRATKEIESAWPKG